MTDDTRPKSTAGTSARLLVALLVLNGVFLAVHILHQASFALPLPSFLRSGFLSLSEDVSAAGFFLYTVECVIVLLLILLVRRTGDKLYIGWAALFLFFAIDDPLQVHERVGEWFAERFPDVAFLHLRAEDTFEMGVLLLPGLMFLVLIVLALRRPRGKRQEHLVLVGLVALLAAFGVGVDLVHVGIREGSRVIYYGMGMLEDGGEMLIMSIICWYLFRAVGRLPGARTDGAAAQSP